MQQYYNQQQQIMNMQTAGIPQPNVFINQPQAVIPQPIATATAAPRDIEWLKINVNKFEEEFSNEEQKNILGNMMYQKVNELGRAPTELIPKITGMLIDLEVLGLPEIIEILENKELLYERMLEAIKIIEEDQNN